MASPLAQAEAELARTREARDQLPRSLMREALSDEARRLKRRVRRLRRRERGG